MSSIRPVRLGWALLSLALLGLPLILGQGCPPVGPAGGAPSVSLQFPNLDRSVALGEQVTVVYTAVGATSVRAFYDHDGRANSGDEVVFATNLPAGANQVTQLATATLPTGLYYIGVTGSNSAGSSTAYAAGKLTLVGNALITFLSPVTDVNIGPGVSVPVRFDAGVTSFSYRLFYDRDSTANGNEVTITQGQSGGSSLVEKGFDTSMLASGTYYIGVAVTTSVGSTATQYASGRVILVTGVYVQVLAPTVGLRVTVGDPVQVVVAANDPANPNLNVRIFYDLDRTFGNGSETTINVVPASAGGTVWDTTGVPAGNYYVGAELQNGLVPAITSYSSGTVEVAEGTGGGGGTGGILTVIAPSADERMYEGAETEIRWYSDVSLAAGTLALFRDKDANLDGLPDGSPVQIVAGLNPALRVYSFTTQGLIGYYFIIAKLTMPDSTVYTATSRGRLVVRPPLYWVGGLNADTGFAGCTLRGFNFRDLAGSNAIPAGDVDGDGIDDFIVISQYGKPGLVNPQGVGYGEAYLIFGNRFRLTGTYDLNRTGYKPANPNSPGSASPTDGFDQGVIFAGIPIQPGSLTTSGINGGCLAPDMDGDGNNEIILATRQADSFSLYWQQARILFEGLLEDDSQFMRGGIVIVSSRNSLLSDRSAISRDLNRVIRLQEVGQAFSDGCGPWTQGCSIGEPGCIGVEPCLGQTFKDSDSDGKCDTYDYSAWWPGYFLQAPWVDPPLATRMSWLCPASGPPIVTGVIRDMTTDTPAYDDTHDLEPYGCRILGQALEDGSTPDSLFGTSVASIQSDAGYDLLLISAPNQTARMVDVPELTADRTGSGVVYVLATAHYWDPNDRTPISISRPHQYIIRTGGYETSYVMPYGSPGDLILRPYMVVGRDENVRISGVTAIPDFNQDGRMDFVVGSPEEGNAQEGAAYIVFRRPTELEGNYLLEDLARAPSDPERLNGVLIVGEPGDRLGEAVAGGSDFNGDGTSDVLIGLPNHDGGRGAALIIFGRQNLVSPENGFTISDLVAQGYGALLLGAAVGDLAGFNTSPAGDVDNDGKDDLLIAAPGASPRFDSNGDGTKDAVGLDYNGDGVADDLTNSGQSTDLTRAGLVYLVKGSNVLAGEISLSLIGTKDLEGYVFVGRAKDDALGGGVSPLGLGARSKGLTTAGDVDNDGRGDMLIGAMLSSPDSKTHAGECYLIYGGIQP